MKGRGTSSPMQANVADVLCCLFFVIDEVLARVWAILLRIDSTT